MATTCLNSEVATWITRLAALLDRRCAWRLVPIMTGLLFATGRRTVSSWLRAGQLSDDYQDYYYFLAILGRKIESVAFRLLGIVADVIAPSGRILLAIDDTPSKRYGPKVEGAGIHHNPTPGPADSKFLYGHSWVVPSRIARHEHHGAIGLPRLGHLYVRKKDVLTFPPSAGISFRTKVQMAAEQVDWLRSSRATAGRPGWRGSSGDTIPNF